MSKPALTTREDFESWVDYMAEGIKHFLNSLPEQVRVKLDYSPESLDVLEDWLLRTYPTTKSMLEADQAALVGGAARYVGETFRRRIGGLWDIRLDDPQFAFFAMPILTGFEERSTPICPLTLVTASGDRRTGKFIRTVMENTMKRLASKK
jgi:hypothetical protein